VGVNWRIIKALSGNEWLNLRHNKAAIIPLMLAAFLSLIIIIFNSLITTAATTRLQNYVALSVVAYDPDHLEMDKVLGFTHIYTTTVKLVSNPQAVRDAMQAITSTYCLGLVLPDDLRGLVAAGGKPTIEMYASPLLTGPYFRALVQSNVGSYLDKVTAYRKPYTVTLKMLSPSLSPTATVSSTLASISSKLNDPTYINHLQQVFLLVFVPFLFSIYTLPEVLVEEKERKTLRMLLTSPASPLAIIMAKGLVGSGYALVLASPAVLLNWGQLHNPLAALGYVVLAILLGSSVGLLLGTLVNTVRAVSIWAGVILTLLTMPALIGLFISNGPLRLLHAWPTYPLLVGAGAAADGSLLWDKGLLYAAVPLVAAALTFTLAAWIMQRRARS